MEGTFKLIGPKKPDGSIYLYGIGLEDNDVDALRHAFKSRVGRPS